jgi:acyl-CoA reductase-like NAD-dependent aldehyde dehydrogenase
VVRKEDLDAAVDHARTAFKSWSKTTHNGCSNLLLAYAYIVEANREGLERLQTMEQGKSIGLANTEVGMAVRWLRTFATMELKDEVLEDSEE